MAQLIVAASVAEYIYELDAIYATAHNAAVGSASSGPNVVEIANTKAANYYVYRGALVFDPTAITPGEPVVSAFVSVYAWADSIYTPFDVVLVSGADLTDVIVGADYGDLLDEVISFGSIASAAWVNGIFNNIPLSVAGIVALQAAIDGGLKIRFGIRHSLDISNSIPTNFNLVQFLGLGFGNDAKLTVNYGMGFPHSQAHII